MYLDFEKPIAELEEKLADMKNLSGESDSGIKTAVEALEKKNTNVEKRHV